MAKEKQQTVRIPLVGYFAIGPGEKRRPGVRKYHTYKIPKAPCIGLNDPVENYFRNVPPRSLKSLCVEALNSVREREFCGFGVEHDWLLANGLIEAVRADWNDSFRIDIKYKVTERGEEFMRQHEAPLCWA